jgi:uncharacterized protein YqfB (UPF0267 family)
MPVGKEYTEQIIYVNKTIRIRKKQRKQSHYGPGQALRVPGG